MPYDATPERKFVVFVSSVTTEFDGLRQQLWESIYMAGHIPVVLEKNPATEGSATDFIKKEVEKSDAFVFILGREYGRRSAKDEPSFIDTELQRAMDCRIPIIFLRALYAKPTEQRPQSPEQKEIEDKYNVMHSRVEKIAKQTIEFRAESSNGGQFPELKERFSIALRNLAASLREGGWIPAAWFDAKSEQITLGATVSQNPFFERIVKRLDSFTTLSARTVSSLMQKRALASFFWDVLLARLPFSGVKRLFFESGSTIAYLSHEFVDRMRFHWVRRWIEERKLVIDTNNILTYLEFILAEPSADPVECRLRPPGPADTYYGATFGRLTSLVELWPPMVPRSLSKKETEAAELMSETLSLNGDALVLMTASGLDNSTPGFMGPHVGSYYNNLIKRVLLTSDAPTVLVLEQNKVFMDFRKGRCFPVCEGRRGAASWSAIRRNKPLAIVTCESAEEDGKRRDALKKLGFSVLRDVESAVDGGDAAGGARVRCILAANKPFGERFRLDA